MEAHVEAPTTTLTDVLARAATLHAERTGRTVADPRQLLDMLVAARDDDDFWEDLARAARADDPEVDMQDLRRRLPDAPFPAELGVEDCLARLGLAEADIAAALDGEAVQEAIDRRIAEAFAQDDPKAVARSLEDLLDTPPTGLLARALAHRPALARGLGMVFSVTTLATLAFGSLTACYKGVTPEA